MTAEGSRLSAQCCSHQQLELGEGVRWDGRRDELLWVDVHRGRLHIASVSGTGLDRLAEIDVGGPLTGVSPLPAVDVGWLVGHGRGRAARDRSGRLRELVAPGRHRPGHSRVNGGACDAEGRLWLGSMEY